MKTTFGQVNNGQEKGWTVCQNNGGHVQMTHLSGISKDLAFQVARSKENVEWVRPFAVRGGFRVVGV